MAYNHTEYQRAYYRKHPERYILNQAKQRARKQNLPFDLVLEDIVTPTHCPVLGMELKRNFGGKSYKGNSPSLDRIDPKLGYVKGNVQVISHRANVMKNDATFDELKRFAEWVKQSIP